MKKILALGIAILLVAFATNVMAADFGEAQVTFNFNNPVALTLTVTPDIPTFDLNGGGIIAIGTLSITINDNRAAGNNVAVLRATGYSGAVNTPWDNFIANQLNCLSLTVTSQTGTDEFGAADQVYILAQNGGEGPTMTDPASTTNGTNLLPNVLDSGFDGSATYDVKMNETRWRTENPDAGSFTGGFHIYYGISP